MEGKALTAAAAERRAKAYFAQAAGEPVLDEKGVPLMNRGVPVVKGGYPVTMAGLACALGMTRDELKDYPENGPLGKVLRRAKAQAEAYAEAALYESGTSSGAKFALSHNFEGWEEAARGPRALWELSDEELDERINELEGNTQAAAET